MKAAASSEFENSFIDKPPRQVDHLFLLLIKLSSISDGHSEFLNRYDEVTQHPTLAGISVRRVSMNKSPKARSLQARIYRFPGSHTHLACHLATVCGELLPDVYLISGKAQNSV